MKTSIISLLFLLLFFNSVGQGNDISRNSFFSTGFAQVKEAANWGSADWGLRIADYRNKNPCYDVAGIFFCVEVCTYEWGSLAVCV
jgi:hypothetical protein